MEGFSLVSRNVSCTSEAFHICVLANKRKRLVLCLPLVGKRSLTGTDKCGNGKVARLGKKGPRLNDASQP